VTGVAGGVAVLALGDRRYERLPAASRRRVVAVAGGPTRAISVLNGLQALVTAGENDWVLVHDAARPCVQRRDVEALIAACRRDPVGGILAVPVADTIKQADDVRRSERSLPRERLWRAQTPQMFRHGRLLRALTQALTEGFDPTDEAAAIEKLGLKPLLVEGSPWNVKVTRPADLAAAGALMRAARRRA
jgi:2-C-methyl-D-erythritol 4-phosphate cytidylyltransferase